VSGARHTSSPPEPRVGEKRGPLSRRLVPLAVSIIAGAGAFATMAEGWKSGQVSISQFVLAVIASIATGTVTYVGLRYAIIESQQRSQKATSPDSELPTLTGPLDSERPPGHNTPFQLPPDIGDFTGREDALLQMHEVLKRSQSDQSSPMIVTMIAGQGGVGKTALAVHVAHELRPRFPDGQLYVNLRGVEAQALDPIDVLADFLRALGVDGAAIPLGLEERAKLYRARLANLRVLVLLDNAASERQVRPLLPGSTTCATLITSRIHLAGIEAGRSINLDVLSHDQAVELLGKIAGRERVDAEPEAARTIAQLCGYLPLAVRIAGAKLAAKRHWRLATSP